MVFFRCRRTSVEQKYRVIYSTSCYDALEFLPSTAYVRLSWPGTCVCRSAIGFLLQRLTSPAACEERKEKNFEAQPSKRLWLSGIMEHVDVCFHTWLFDLKGAKHTPRAEGLLHLVNSCAIEESTDIPDPNSCK